MRNETQPKAVALEELASHAQPLTTPLPQQSAASTNHQLAANLNHVRGEAIQRAKAKNTRLRHFAIFAAAISFTAGASLGYLLAGRKS